MAENTTTDAMPAASRVVEDTAEDEIDLTKDKVTWTAPKPEPKPAAAKKAKPASQARRGGTPIVGAILGFAGILVLLLLIAMTAVLWNRVDELEDQVDGRPVTAQTSDEGPTDAQVEALEERVADLQATVDALDAAPQGDAPIAPAAEIAALTARLDTTIACLNTYMDTVAQATNSNASYTYVPC